MISIGLLIPAAMKRPPKTIPLKTIRMPRRLKKARSRANSLWAMSPPRAAPRWNSRNRIFRMPISLHPKLRQRRTRASLSAMTKRRTKRSTKIPITPASWIPATMIPITMSIHTITKMNIIRNITMTFTNTTTANTNTPTVIIMAAMIAAKTVVATKVLAGP